MPQRVYRHDFRCPHCRSNSLPKAGPSAASRPTHARDCPHRFTPDGNRHYYPEHVNRRALKTYEDGSSISAISRVMGVKEATIYSLGQEKLVLGSGDGVPQALAARGSDA